MLHLKETHLSTCQERFFCGSFVVVVAPSFLALKTTMQLGSIFCLFSQWSVIIKAVKHAWIRMSYLNQMHSYTCQGRSFCRSLVVVGAPPFLALNNSWLFGCFSQCSVIIKAKNMDKYILLHPNSFLHLSGKAFLQEFCGG